MNKERELLVDKEITIQQSLDKIEELYSIRYQKQIGEIFSKLRWDIRTQAVENIITWDAVSLVIKKYESKYLSQSKGI
jgi:hypothetical protein